MAKATWKDTELAESDNCVVVEGDQYFPREDINEDYLIASDHHTTCPWKGVASYYHIEVDGIRNENGAFYYPEPKEAALHIKDYIAFWNGVNVEV